MARTYDTNVCLQQLYRTVLKNALTRILTFSLSLSLTSSLLFWTWQQAVNGKNNDESFLTSARYRSMNTRTLEHVGQQRTDKTEGKGSLPLLLSRRRFKSTAKDVTIFKCVSQTNAIERDKNVCVYTPVSLYWCVRVCVHLSVCLCVEGSPLTEWHHTYVCIFMCMCVWGCVPGKNWYLTLNQSYLQLSYIE